MASHLRSLLQGEFLKILSEIHPGFLTENLWLERRQRFIAETEESIKSHPERQIELEGVPRFFYTDYYDEINRACFDLSSIVKLLEKCYCNRRKIDEENLSDTLDAYILKKRTERSPYPVYFQRDHAKFLERLVSAFIKTIKRVRWHEQILDSDAISPDKIMNTKKSGPKGQRSNTIQRQAAIKVLVKNGSKDQQACTQLKNQKIPLPSKKLQTIYKYDWPAWFRNAPTAFHKQWSRDTKSK